VFGQFMHRLLAEFAPVVFMSVGKVFHSLKSSLATFHMVVQNFFV